MNPPDRPFLCLITSLERLGDPAHPATSARLLLHVRDAAAAGVSLVQVREPSLEAAALLALTCRVLDAVEGTGCRVLVNDRIDVALAGGAHGVHLRADSCPAARVRRLAPGLLIGRSIHTAAEAERAARAGQVDYLLFGTVFPTRSKPSGHPVAGLPALAEAVRAAGALPVLAIGGLTAANAADAARAGAAGVAGISLFLEPDPAGPGTAETVARLLEAFHSSSRSCR